MEEFNNWLKLKGRSHNTRRGYCQRVRDFLQATNNAVTKESVDRYLLGLQGDKVNKTINCYRNAISAYIEWKKIDIEMPPELKEAKKIPDAINIETFENEVIPIVKENFKDPERIIAIFYLLFYSGLRPSEIVALKRKDIDLKNLQGRVFRQKTNGDDIFIFPQKVSDLMKIYFILETEKTNAFNTTTRMLGKMCEKIKKHFPDFNLRPYLLRHCVSEDTEMLTLSGWKKYKDIHKGEEAFSYNIKTDKLVQDKIYNIHSYKFKGKLNKFITKYIDFMGTNEHHHIFKIAKGLQLKNKRFNQWDGWELITVQKFLETKNKVLAKCKHGARFNGKNSIGIPKAFLLGLILTDGSINNRRKSTEITISQSLSANKHKCEKIQKMLTESRLKFSALPQKPQINNFSGEMYQMMTFRIFRESQDWIFKYITKNRQLTKEILNLKQEELKAVFDGLMLGDGSRNSEFCDQQKNIIELFQTLCILLGYRTYLTKDKKYRTYISYRDNSNITPKHISKQHYNGIVWCPTTKNGTWIARRNRKVFITGNSSATRLLKEGFNLLEIQDFLGHTNLKSTQKYLRTNKDELKEKYLNKIK